MFYGALENKFPEEESFFKVCQITSNDKTCTPVAVKTYTYFNTPRTHPFRTQNILTYTMYYL